MSEHTLKGNAVQGCQARLLMISTWISVCSSHKLSWDTAHKSYWQLMIVFWCFFCTFGAWWALSLSGIELNFFLMEKNRKPNRFRLTWVWVNGFIEWTNLLNPVLFNSWNLETCKQRFWHCLLNQQIKCSPFSEVGMWEHAAFQCFSDFVCVCGR